MKPEEIRTTLDFPEVFLAGVMAFVYSFSATLVVILLYIGVI